jgi:hypothetical protein
MLWAPIVNTVGASPFSRQSYAILPASHILSEADTDVCCRSLVAATPTTPTVPPAHNKNVAPIQLNKSSFSGKQST